MASALLKQAISLHRGGKIAAAEQMYRRVLREEPGNSDALHFLGLVAHQSGRHSEAADHIGKAITIRPTSLYWYNLGHVHLALKDNAAAEAAFCRAVELTSTHSEALFQLGLLRLASDDLDNAKDHFRRAIAAKPDFVEARINLALLLHRSGDSAAAAAHLDEAQKLQPDNPEIHNARGITTMRDAASESIRHFERALELRPDYAEARINLAKSLYQELRHTEAAELLEQMARQRPVDLDVRMLLGSTYAELNEPDAAARHYHDAAEVTPGSPRPLVAMGHLMLRFGRFDEAYRAYQRARSADPLNCDAAAAMLTHLKSHISAGEIEQISALLQNSALADGQRRQLHFAFAAYLDAAGEHDHAFIHMDEGNRLRRKELETQSRSFDLGAHVARVDSIIRNFNEIYFRRTSGCGVASELPVFIVGMPRSGTTLCEQILASHPKVFGAGELNDISQIARRLRGELGGSSDEREFADFAKHFHADTIRKTALQHIARLGSLAPGATRVVDKMPMNFQHLGLIATLFPFAKIIHCRRNAMDVGLSCYSKDFPAALAWSCDLTAIGQVHRQYERLMAHWSRVLPVEVLEFSYEDVIGNAELHARRLVQHCGLEWDDACLAFHRAERQIKTASLQQVRQPIYGSSVHRWQKYHRHLEPVRTGLSKT